MIAFLRQPFTRLATPGLKTGGLKTPSLKTRVSLLCTALACVLLLFLGSLWLTQTRNSIHEEIEAASRVASQWLIALDRQGLPPQQALALVQQVGRVRANGLDVVDADGQLLYRAPSPSYKAGRQAPDWFAALVQPDFPSLNLPLATHTVHLQPDPSRATLDAWDELTAMTGWALALLTLLFLAMRFALNRSLQPLTEVMVALDKTGQGEFATRLPLYPVRELHHLACSFNAMNDRLDAAIRDNVRLQSEQAVAGAINGHLEEERKAIARELHDELAQGITAVRALAGAIAHKGRDDSTLHGAAQSILAVAGEMQQGVKAILQRLRPPLRDGGLERALEQHLYLWQERHPEVHVHLDLAADALPHLDEARAHALLRMVQEGLTNAARYADANNIWITLCNENAALSLQVHDDGKGLTTDHSASQGSSLGLAGLQERLEALGGQLTLSNGPHGGAFLQAFLPWRNAATPLTSPASQYEEA
jgi:two-component system sensor histidine kinase UhpB